MNIKNGEWKKYEDQLRKLTEMGESGYDTLKTILKCTMNESS